MTQSKRTSLAGGLAVLLALAAATGAHAATGGPDGFGYTWRDVAEPGVTFAWEDISVTGTDVSYDGDDQNYGYELLTFPFPYYGNAYTQVAITSNGWVSPVDDVSAAFGNGNLPAVGAPRGIIAGFWDDLTLNSATDRVLFQSFADRAVVTWEKVPLLRDDADEKTFQIILYADGRIAVQWSEAGSDRGSSTVGIESPDELNGLTVFSNTGTPPDDGYRVEFYPPVPVPNNLDCAGATVVNCGARVSGDTRLGAANQDGYLCSRGDYSGAEQIYRIDLAAPTTLRVILDTISGNPDFVLLAGCDPNTCLAPPTDRAQVNNVTGTVYIVVDSGPGAGGQYQLRVDCLPLTANFTCPGPAILDCNATYTGTTATAGSVQHAYACSDLDFSGRERVYEFNTTSTDFTLVLRSITGDQTLLVLNGCDPNACVSGGAGDAVNLTTPGTYTVIIDSPPGQEGQYELEVRCYPLPTTVDCAGAAMVVCGDTVAANTQGTTNNQTSYWCATPDYAGGEVVYLLDIGAADVAIDFAELSGDPDLIVLQGCDANDCQVLDAGMLTLNDATGPIYLVVDSEAGQEGAFRLTVNCVESALQFCTDGLLELEPWFEDNGAWLVYGWMYHPGDTHNYSLRVDGNTVYGHDGSCNAFSRQSHGVIPGSGEAFVQWEAPEGTVRTTMRETTVAGCCGLLVTMTVTNTDTVPHSYDFRAYHDIAFGEYDDVNGTCNGFPGGTVDGGAIEVNGTRYVDEVELLSIGGATCEGQVQMFSADFPADVASSFEMLGPNLPDAMEFLDWPDGLTPCTQWTGYANGGAGGECFEDSALMMSWRFPQGAGTLAPGESASSSYRIGLRCAFPCIACESPSFSGAVVEDVTSCNDGIKLSWPPATFPGRGDGTYHVYRSELSAAHALTLPPITSGGVFGTTFTDRSAMANTPYFYVVQAESLEYPNCGTGPLIAGSTAESIAAPSPVTDAADTVGPSSDVGDALRAVGHTQATVDFTWVLAPATVPGEQYVILRSDDDPTGPFVSQGATTMTSWTDPSAPPRFDPVHVWYYDVRIADPCGNVSAD